MRTVKEWIADHDDQAVPPRVRLRVFARHNGICHLSGRTIRPGDAWDVDHIVALANGGAHRELNLAPALRDKHREKTAKDLAEKSKVATRAKSHLGIKPKRQKIQSRRFDKAPGQRRASTPVDKWRGFYGRSYKRSGNDAL